jgi:hypothetical protein
LIHASAASDWPSNNCSSGTRHGAQSFSGSASHAGFGRLPATVVLIMVSSLNVSAFDVFVILR